jgi:hypothetical protein
MKEAFFFIRVAIGSFWPSSFFLGKDSDHLPGRDGKELTSSSCSSPSFDPWPDFSYFPPPSLSNIYLFIFTKCLFILFSCFIFWVFFYKCAEDFFSGCVAFPLLKKRNIFGARNIFHPLRLLFADRVSPSSFFLILNDIIKETHPTPPPLPPPPPPPPLGNYCDAVGSPALCSPRADYMIVAHLSLAQEMASKIFFYFTFTTLKRMKFKSFFFFFFLKHFKEK